MEDKGSKVLKSSNRIRGYLDRRRESEGSVRLADIQVHQGHTKVFRTNKLLLPVH